MFKYDTFYPGDILIKWLLELLYPLLLYLATVASEKKAENVKLVTSKIKPRMTQSPC
jgi:hypothetical protein